MPKTRFEAEDNGVDIIIDCTGVPGENLLDNIKSHQKYAKKSIFVFLAALENAIPWTKMGATIMVFGCAPVGKTMRICPEEIFAKELTILGTKINPFTFPDATNLVANMGSKYIDYEKLGIGVYDLEDYQEALIKLKQGRISKIIFKMDD